MSHESPLLIGLDIGTSGIKALAFSLSGEALAEGRASLTTAYASNGQAEQVPLDWWHGSVEALRTLSAKLGQRGKDVQGIGLTGQCPTFTCLLPESGPLGQGLLYQDNRAVVESRELIQRYGGDEIHRRTGQAPSPFYILPKLLWLKKQRLEAIPPGSFVVQPRDLVGWYLTGQIATDPTHAACTLAYDLREKSWNTDWLQELGLGQLRWPELLAPSSILGYLTPEAAESSSFRKDLPVILGAADSIGAAYGAQASETGLLCEVTGTSTCLHLTLEEPARRYEVNTYPHIDGQRYCGETGLNTTGGALAWLERLAGQDLPGLLAEAETIEPGADGLIFLPHLAGGERDNPARTGAFIGLQLGHTSAHLARALLEGVAFALRQRIAEFLKDGCQVTRIVSCGGTARSALWAQIKADIIGLPLETVFPADTTAWGAALLAGQALGLKMEGTAFTHTHFQAVTQHTRRYEEAYGRFCQLEELLSIRYFI